MGPPVPEHRGHHGVTVRDVAARLLRESYNHLAVEEEGGEGKRGGGGGGEGGGGGGGGGGRERERGEGKAKVEGRRRTQIDPYL